jgi:hypothetical protein
MRSNLDRYFSYVIQEMNSVAHSLHRAQFAVRLLSSCTRSSIAEETKGFGDLLFGEGAVREGCDSEAEGGGLDGAEYGGSDCFSC